MYVVGLAIFPFVFLAIPLILSKRIWGRLSSRFQIEGAPKGDLIDLGTFSVGFFLFRSYEARISEDGLFLLVKGLLKKIFKPVLIPWVEIKKVEDDNSGKAKLKELVVGDPKIEKIIISEDAFQHIYPYLSIES